MTCNIEIATISTFVDGTPNARIVLLLRKTQHGFDNAYLAKELYAELLLVAERKRSINDIDSVNPELFNPILEMARSGELVLIYDETLSYRVLQDLRIALYEILEREDSQCGDCRFSSPPCGMALTRKSD